MDVVLQRNGKNKESGPFMNVKKENKIGSVGKEKGEFTYYCQPPMVEIAIFAKFRHVHEGNIPTVIQ